MKEELEKLGFEKGEHNNYYKLLRDDDLEYVCIYENTKECYIADRKNEVYLFPYNNEKLKQLIKLLS